MTLRLQLVNLAWDGVFGSSGYDILLDGKKVASAGSKARTTKITIPEGAEHLVTIKAQPSGQVQEARFEWANVIPAPPPPPPPPDTWTGPLVITKGGTYNVSAEATAAAGENAVSIQTSEPVILTGRVRKLVAGDTAPIVRCPPGFGARVTIQRLTITGVLKGYGRAIQAEGYNSLEISNCSLDTTGGIDIRNGLAGSSVVVTRNRSRNIQGTYPRALYPSEPKLHRQFCQLNGVTNPSIEVSWNEVVNEYGKSQIEDMISVYGGTKDALIEHNYLQGGFPWDVRNTYSGDGIILGDSGGDGSLVQFNQIVGHGHVGIGIEGGQSNRVENNRIVSGGKTDTGELLRAAALGLYIPNSVAGRGNTAKGNLIRFMAHSPNSGDPIAAGSLNRGDQYTPGAGNNVAADNTFSPSGVVTQADEAAEWTFWKNKLAANGLVVGA